MTQVTALWEAKRKFSLFILAEILILRRLHGVDRGKCAFLGAFTKL